MCCFLMCRSHGVKGTQLHLVASPAHTIVWVLKCLLLMEILVFVLLFATDGQNLSEDLVSVECDSLLSTS